MLLLSNTVNAAVKGNVDNISVQVLDAEYNPIIPRSQQDSKYTVPLHYNLNPAHNASVGFGNIYLYNRYKKAVDKKFLNYSNDFIKQQEK